MRRLSLQSQTSIKLAELLRAQEPGFAQPCGGQHRCGKCSVLAEGDIGPIKEEEAALLQHFVPPRPAPEGFAWRMACCADVKGTALCLLPDQEGQSPCSAAPQEACWVAVDIGTTTVCYAVYDAGTQDLLLSDNVYSRQAGFGADVLSRIEYADRQGVEPLRQAITTQLQELLASLFIQRLVITGNTTMLHLLTGLSPHSLGVAPFTPVSLFGKQWSLFGVEAYLPRCISTYVGADISCGILATNLCQEGKTRLLVDVGTNGEMALFAAGKLLCCSTAAGPAFEGAQIHRGMPAKAGAIDRTWWQEGTLVCHTINDAPPLGICGTGLISAVNQLLRHGMLDETGRLCADPLPLGNSGVVLTQQDVRNVQLAKAAIRAGIETLLMEAKLAPEDVDELLLCGGFGKALDPAEAAGIGLIPPALVSKTIAAGNTALAGASLLLFQPQAVEQMDAIAQRAQELSLSSSPFFTERYIDEMMFEEA